MKNDPPNAEQKRWREIVRQQGCILGHGGPVEIHHVAGRTASHCKIHIGHWFIIPVSNQAHRVVEALPYRDQKAHFMNVCRRHIGHFQDLPFDANTMWAIMDWRR